MKSIFSRPLTTLSGVPTGLDGKLVGELTALSAQEGQEPLLFVARDGQRLAEIEQAIRFFAPAVEILLYPAWDSLPYDRASPHPAVVSRRMATLSALAGEQKGGAPRVVLTTANAVIQRVPPREQLKRQARSMAAGNRIRMEEIIRWLEDNGFLRSATVREAGEYAVRGGIIDLYAAGGEPVRLDFFGDTLESIRTFDLETQRTVGQRSRIDLVPTSEVTITPETISRFRERYVAMFGAPGRDDHLYAAISEGRRHPGYENWMPLFAERLDTIFDYLGNSAIALDHLTDEAIAERHAEIVDHYEARRDALAAGEPGAAQYKPVPPASLYLEVEEWTSRLTGHPVVRLSPFQVPDAAGVIQIEGRQGRTFAAERQVEGANLFDAVIAHIDALRANGKRVVVACWSEGTRDRLVQLLADHDLRQSQLVANWPEAEALPAGVAAVGVLAIEAGFETDDLAVVGEQDILGDRLVRTRRRSRRAADFLSEVTSLAAGDLVVHVDHGIGRFVGLTTITAAGAPHDCLELTYAGGDRLYLPVENIELLSRYGSDETEAALDKLGGSGWQARKARMKRRILEMAEQLIQIAAARALREGVVLTPPEGMYDEFAARFPYEETEDQDAAIDAVLDDLASGKPMDRLVCGDVGFGKTEVALRAAFVAAMNGKQVAVVVPTTLLARQHSRTFISRFAGFPVRVAQLSRLVSARESAETKKALAEGKVDIVVGTHAILGKGVTFKDLGLLIVDEEQHFGVKHKERLKELRADVHVLTMTATPIPRTLQLALTGVREMSLITTPPVDRLAVRTFVSPFDSLVVREALLRERYRGGQAFFVCPRIGDLPEAREFLEREVPEVKVAVAHGQLPPGELDDIMNAFYEGAYDVLLSTTIVESGLDVPSANTLIVQRSDMFGLAQLYQLRGRVGRSKTRAYALLTTPPDRMLTPNAERRLKVLQSLDSLGAGFQLASHDLDIRGAGNLLGEEQSGHIKEVGYELYQQMLEEAVAALKDGSQPVAGDQWSPQITIGMPVMIPESYVPDLQLRMSLYRRLAELTSVEDIDGFGAEMIDRFGKLPEEVESLLKIVLVKALCRRANVEKLDAGPKGVVVSFRENRFANPGGLVRWIAEQGSLAKIRPDQKVVVIRDWEKAEQRLKGVAVIMTQFARLAEAGEKEAA
ncbi:MAG: transcription-repair coupling factor [Bauldia sp.]|nr:transcription-repair coupling factor [Bauldia sp.]